MAHDVTHRTELLLVLADGSAVDVAFVLETLHQRIGPLPFYTEIIAYRIVIDLEIVQVHDEVIDILLKYRLLGLRFGLQALHLSEIDERQYTQHYHKEDNHYLVSPDGLGGTLGRIVSLTVIFFCHKIKYLRLIFAVPGFPGAALPHKYNDYSIGKAQPAAAKPIFRNKNKYIRRKPKAVAGR